MWAFMTLTAPSCIADQVSPQTPCICRYQAGIPFKTRTTSYYERHMRAFDVRLNAKALCVAGIDGDGVVTTIITSVAGRGGQSLSLTVGGLVSGVNEHVMWRARGLKVGDEVTLKVVEVDSADRPRTRRRSDPKEEERRAKAYARSMVKKFGWKLAKATRKAR